MLQKDKKAQNEQRAILQTHAAVSKALASAQQSWTEQVEQVLERCQQEQSGLNERLTGARSRMLLVD
jgi:hypothetical protein